MKLNPLTRRARLAFVGATLAVAAGALVATAVAVGTTEAYRLGLALSLVAAFAFALLHNLTQAHAISRRAHRGNP